MCPNFIALFNKAGIACAADADHTLFRLSKSLPVAVAINPLSLIPWEQIIHEYQQTGQVKERLSMLDYAADFNAFLSSVPVRKDWAVLPSQEMNLIFLGYGSQDIFPSVYDVLAEVDNETLRLGKGEAMSVGEDDMVFFNLLGDFDSISTLIGGVSKGVHSFFLESNIKMVNTYADKVRERFRGTEYEAYVERHLAAYNAERGVNIGLESVSENIYSDFRMGVDSFSIEDMVTAVETLVEANAELIHLRSGAAGESAKVKEIAVLTIPEGLTWIKHSLYYRRNEI